MNLEKSHGGARAETIKGSRGQGFTSNIKTNTKQGQRDPAILSPLEPSLFPLNPWALDPLNPFIKWVYKPQITPESKAFRNLKAERTRQYTSISRCGTTQPSGVRWDHKSTSKP
jgi:hypothetical protein